MGKLGYVNFNRIITPICMQKRYRIMKLKCISVAYSMKSQFCKKENHNNKHVFDTCLSVD